MESFIILSLEQFNLFHQIPTFEQLVYLHLLALKSLKFKFKVIISIALNRIITIIIVVLIVIIIIIKVVFSLGLKLFVTNFIKSIYYISFNGC